MASRKYRPLTVGQLHKILGKMIEKGHKRRKVAVSKTTFSSNLESDGCTILDAYSCRIETINIADDDGGIAVTKAGLERYVTTAILFGNADENNQT